MVELSLIFRGWLRNYLQTRLLLRQTFIDFFRCGVVGFGALCIIGTLGLKLSLYDRPIATKSGNDENN